jgi:hypothetical protein
MITSPCVTTIAGDWPTNVVVVPLPITTTVTPAGGLNVESLKVPLPRSTVIVTDVPWPGRPFTAAMIAWRSSLVADEMVGVEVVSRTISRFWAVMVLTVWPPDRVPVMELKSPAGSEKDASTVSVPAARATVGLVAVPPVNVTGPPRSVVPEGPFTTNCTRPSGTTGVSLALAMATVKEMYSPSTDGFTRLATIALVAAGLTVKDWSTGVAAAKVSFPA